MRRPIALTVLAVAVLAACTACAGAPRSPDAIKVVYLNDGNPAMAAYMNRVTAQFRAAHPDAKVDLEAVQATDADYYTKVALMNRSPSTAPDVIWEDTFQVKADAAAGYLQPLDPYLAHWSDWKRFVDAGRAGGKGEDGKQYGVPAGTDVQVLWYRKDLLRKAGVTVPWRPRTWDDVLQAARAVKARTKGVVPINVYASKVGAEATSVRGVQTLLSGTDGVLYAKGRWVSSSPGFTATLGFLKTVYGEGLGPPNQTTSDPNYPNIPSGMLKDGTLAIDSDGSFISNAWAKGGSTPWPSWSRDLGVAAWPTEDGKGAGTTSMSGGWTFAMGSRSAAKPLAFDFITTAVDEGNALRYAVDLSNIPVRSDVAASAAYRDSSPTASFFSSLVDVTHFRPAIAAYPQVSNQLAVAADAVSTNGQSVATAAKGYATGLEQVVGPDDITKG